MAKKMTREDFAESVKTARGIAGLTQTELGAKSEAGQGAVSFAELGKPGLSIEKAAAIAKTLKIVAPSEWDEGEASDPKTSPAVDKAEAPTRRRAGNGKPGPATPEPVNLLQAGAAIDQIETILARVPAEKRARVLEWINRDFEATPA